MHGLKYVWNTEISLLRRVIWALLILGGSGYILTATYMFLDNFSNKLLTTKISIKNTPNLTFPTITICNQNFWKKSMFEQNFRENSEAKAVWREIMRDLYISKEPPADDKYNWSAPYLESAAQPIGNDEVDNFLSSRAHSINETFIRCMLLDNEAPCNEIFELKRTDSGYCAQFNGKGDVISHSAGVSGGLRLYLDAKVDEYYVGPNSFAEGFSY
ncbi:hypothetical protein EB796_007397 [Bugula neritina]|uniref:SCNN1D n=1 Tax=Bugula neritina TaxID=10212 RepID=A0A7J7K8Y3_BUGNE|nr:hypothetical protein EB796_007397 [Bugula neritina]